MAKLSQVEKNLIAALRDIWDDRDFVLGILTDLETDDERQQVIDYIENNDQVTTEDLVLMALHIDNTRTG